MKAEIYFFSGTGNTLQIAKIISNLIKADINPIIKFINNNKITLKANIIIIIFPVYYGNLPNIIRVFAEKLVNIKNKKFILIANYGGGTGVSLITLSRIIKSKGGIIFGRYGLHMPQNSFYKFWENNKKTTEKTNEKIRKIVKYFNKKNLFSNNLLLELIQIPFQILFNFLVKRHLIKITNENKNISIKELIYKTDKSFITNNNCNGCGICVKVCPVKNITIKNKIPKWLNHCENCMACYNYCPQKAISNGIIKNKYYYNNPEIKLSELIKWNK